MTDRTLSGIINVFKESGYTSFDVVAKLRGILKQKKIGHTGTLDPMATGVLPVCVGKATKVVESLTSSKKVYEAVLLLGTTTDTEDITGNVLKCNEQNVSEKEIREVIGGFIGEISQIPPMYSAKKINGKKLYELARKGEEVERKPSTITVYDINILAIDFPEVKMKITCSKGTYIRTLCNDIGEKLGVGGCMKELVRTFTGGFDIKDSYRLSDIEKFVADDDYSFLIGIDEVYANLPKIEIPLDREKLVENGNPVFLDCSENRIRVYMTDGRFAGIYVLDGKVFKPEKMFL